MIQIFCLFGSAFFWIIGAGQGPFFALQSSWPADLSCLWVYLWLASWQLFCRLYFALKYLTGGRKATLLMHLQKRLLAHINLLQDQPILGTTRLMLKQRKCLICIWSSPRLLEFWWLDPCQKATVQLWIIDWLTSSRASYAYQSFLVASRPMSDLLGLWRLTPLRHGINREEGGYIQSTVYHIFVNYGCDRP